MPAVVLLGVEIAALMAFVMLYGMRVGWKFSIGWALETLAKATEGIVIPVLVTKIHPFRYFAVVLRGIDGAFLAAVGKGIEGTEWAATHLFGGLTSAIKGYVEAAGSLATSTAQVLEHLLTVTLPGKLAGLRHLIETRVTALEHALTRLAHTLTHDVTVLRRTVTRDIARVEHTITADVKAIRRTITADLATLRKEIRAAIHTAEVFGSRAIAHEHAYARDGFIDVRKGIDALKGRLGKVEGILTVAGITALLVSALERLGLNWIRCDKVGKYGKQQCQADARLVDGLVDALTILGGAVGIVAAAEILQGTAAETGSLIERLWQG